MSGVAAAAASMTRGGSKSAGAAAAAAAASSSMDEGASDAPVDDAAAARARKSAAATAAAAAACVQLAAAAKGPYSKMHSSEQVLLLDDSEVWDTIAENWCKPGKETISEIVETWDGRDLAACVYKLGLPVLYAKRNYVQHMRRSVVDAVRAYARSHPELFGAAADDAASESEQEAEQPPPPRVHSPPKTPPRSASPFPMSRRSPRATASSRSAAAMALAAVNNLPIVGSASAPPGRSPSGAGRGAVPPPFAKDAARSNRPKSVAPELRLFDAGAGESEPSDGDDSSDDDSGWSPGSDPVDAALRRGGRLRSEDVEHQLAQAGIQRSFAQGFVSNAKFAAGGRSMYQLYKEVTAAFAHESSKRECLALSRILDALLRGDVAAALEHTCRRLGGVHTAAETGNWAMCERLETEAEQRSFVPDAFMRSALKSVTQMQAVKKSVVSSTGAGKGGSKKAAQTNKGGWEPRSTPKSNKKEQNQDNGAGASHKKKGGSESK